MPPLDQTATASVTPTLDTSAYAAGDCLATAVMEFEGLPGHGYIDRLVVIDKAKQDAAGELWLFDTAVTPSTANTAHDPSDADLAHCVAVIPFGPYYDASDNSVSVAKGVNCAYVRDAGTGILYGIAVTRGTPTYAASDLTFILQASVA